MSSRLSPNHLRIYKAVDDILWNDWDPIGVNDSAPRDEYQSYSNQIFSLKIKGAELEAIAQKFYEFETERMGLSGDIERCRDVAEKIVRL